MTEQIDIQLKNIQQQLQQLLKEYQLVQKENQKLKKELEQIQQVHELQNRQLEMLQQKAEVNQLGAGTWSKEEKIALEKRIDVYLKEIEKCILLLNAE
jgi:Txe/YoeB family toxin of Txe-Axe toxin-antitoxin module